jgi:hypothetical protein
MEKFDNILECPLCSAPCYLVRNSKTVVQGEQRKTCYVQCKSCGCRGPRFLLDEFVTPTDARLKAIREWNRRGGKYIEEK